MAEGELTRLSPTHVTGSGTEEFVEGFDISPDGKNLYVANFNRTNIHTHGFVAQFARDALTGKLTPFGSLQVECQNFTRDIACAHTHDFVYALNTVDESVSIFKRNESGELTLVEHANKTGSAFQWTVVIPPDDENVYVGVEGEFGSHTSGSTIQKVVEPSTGKLEGVESGERFSTTEDELFYTRSIFADPNGKWIWVAGVFSNNIGLLLRSTSSGKGRGKLSFVRKHSTGTEPTALMMNPAGTFLYVQTEGTTKGYSVNSEGELTLVTTVTGTVGGIARQMAISSDERFAYIAIEGGIAQFSYNKETGHLTPLGVVSIVLDESKPSLTPSEIKVSPDGQFLYATANPEEPKTGLIYQFATNIVPNEPAKVTGVEPTQGSPAGGTKITVTGTGFREGSTVTVGGVAATEVTIESPTKLKAVTGAHSSGSGEVVVENGAGPSTEGPTFLFVTAPTNTSLPTITGAAVQGQVEVAHEGTWTNGPILKATVQWKREGANIEGATGREYTPTEADVGHTLTVVETVTNTVGSASAESLPTPPIAAGILVNRTLPTITGPAVEGEVELEGHGAWSSIPESFRYQWSRCDKEGGSPVAIEGAHAKTYVPVPADVGHTLRVSETAVNKAGESAPATSLQSPVITATAATRFGLPPTQPNVPEPVLKWPFRMAEDESHIQFVEQDTAEEYEQCVALVYTARPGEFPDEPDFGLSDPAFTEGGVSEADLAAVVRKWEPRAHLFFTQDELNDFAQEVGIQVRE